MPSLIIQLKIKPVWPMPGTVFLFLPSAVHLVPEAAHSLWGKSFFLQFHAILC